MKKIKFIMLILIITLILIFPLTINATQINPDDYSTDGPDTADVQEMYKFGGSVAGVIQIVGTIVAVGTLTIIGIRYVVSSVEEKAEYKERMLPYVIGCVLLFGASNIVNIVYKATTGQRDPIDHMDSEWQGKVYIVQCNNEIIVGGRIETCGRELVIPIPEDGDAKCRSCGAVLYEAYADKPTAKANIISVTDK